MFKFDFSENPPTPPILKNLDFFPMSYPFKVCSKSEYKLCELCSVNMNATTSLQVGQAKQMPHVISNTGGRNYVWGDIIQLRITTRLNYWYNKLEAVEAAVSAHTNHLFQAA